MIAIVSLSVTVVTLTSSVLNAEQVGTSVIRAKREPQHFLGVIIESALTGQHHGFGIYYCSQMQQLSNNINIIMLLRNQHNLIWI